MGNSIKPGEKGGLSLEPGEGLPGLDENILREVPGIRVVAHEIENEPVNLPAITRDQDIERCEVAALAAFHKCDIRGFIAAGRIGRRLTFGRGTGPFIHARASGARERWRTIADQSPLPLPGGASSGTGVYQRERGHRHGRAPSPRAPP